MSEQPTFVRLNDQEVVVRVSEVVVPNVRVTRANVGSLKVMGGVPGPTGAPGADGASDGTLLNEHIVSVTPHPYYDDLPSFTLLYENGLV